MAKAPAPATAAPEVSVAHPTPARLRHAASPVMRELSRLRTQTAILKAQVALLKLRLSANGLRGKLKNPSGNLSGASFSVPQIVSIYGTTKGLYAELRFGGGTTQEVRRGDVLRGGAKVVAIRPDQVLIGYHGRRIPLGFYGGSSGMEGASLLDSDLAPRLMPGRSPMVVHRRRARRHTAHSGH